jgi:PPOX class probable F420-dependent enzyme
MRRLPPAWHPPGVALTCLIIDDSVDYLQTARCPPPAGEYRRGRCGHSSAKALQRVPELLPSVALGDIHLAQESRLDRARQLAAAHTVLGPPRPAPRSAIRVLIASHGRLRRLGPKRTVVVTTDKRDGSAVPAPVHVVVLSDHAYFRTWSTAGKAKRLHREPRTASADCPSTARGKPTGADIAALLRCWDPKTNSPSDKPLSTKEYPSYMARSSAWPTASATTAPSTTG